MALTYADRMYDVHCHIDVLQAVPNQIRGLISSGIKPSSWVVNLERARQWPINICLGVHPFFVEETTLDDLNRLSELVSNPFVVAIGEIGLDYHKQSTVDRDCQIGAFQRQLRLACSLNLPVIIHCRKAFDDLWPLLEAFEPTGVIFHGFSGSVGDLNRAIDRGDFISFGFPITYDDNKKQRTYLADTPLDRIMLETDSPYMKRYGFETSTPDDVRFVYGSAAAIKGIPLIEMISSVRENVRRLWPALREIRDYP